MNKLAKFGITTVIVSLVIAFLLLAIFKALVWAVAKDASKNLDLIMQGNDRGLSLYKDFFNEPRNFHRVFIDNMTNGRNLMFRELMDEFNKYNKYLEAQENDRARSEKREAKKVKNAEIRKKYNIHNDDNFSASATNFNKSARKLNKKTQQENSTMHRILSVLDFALDWPVLDFAAKKVFVKVLQNQMNEILSDLGKIDKLNFLTDNSRKEAIALFFKINARLVVIKFALEVANSRDMKVTSNEGLKKSINDIYTNLVVKTTPHKMQMVDEKGNLIKEPLGFLEAHGTKKEFLPNFPDTKSKPKDIEINKCLLIASTFEGVHELKGHFGIK